MRRLVSTDDSRYRALASAVILRAVADLRYPLPTKRYGRHVTLSNALQTAREIRAEAARFLADGCDGWAELAGVNAHAIARKYRKAA